MRSNFHISAAAYKHVCKILITILHELAHKAISAMCGFGFKHYVCFKQPFLHLHLCYFFIVLLFHSRSTSAYKYAYINCLGAEERMPLQWICVAPITTVVRARRHSCWVYFSDWLRPRQMTSTVSSPNRNIRRMHRRFGVAVSDSLIDFIVGGRQSDPLCALIPHVINLRPSWFPFNVHRKPIKRNEITKSATRWLFAGN